MEVPKHGPRSKRQSHLKMKIIFQIQFLKMLRAFRLTKSTAYSEENSVIVHFLHAVILKQNAGVGIHIGPGVLDLSGFSQDGWHDHVKLKSGNFWSKMTNFRENSCFFPIIIFAKIMENSFFRENEFLHFVTIHSSHHSMHTYKMHVIAF